MSTRFFFGFGALLVFLAGVAHAEGKYQLTRNGKTFVWNNNPRGGDEATWSGGRDRDGYATGYGTLTWYIRDPGVAEPQLYARYWGNMVDGKLSGLVNVHSKKRTHHALFASGARVTRWTAGPARSRMTAGQIALLEKHNEVVSVGEPEPEAPAAGPAFAQDELRGEKADEELNSSPKELVQDLWSERWPKIDIDDSLRLLAFPPRSLRN